MADGAGLLRPHPQWVTLAYVGIGALPVAWLAFCLEFTGRGHWLKPKVVAAALLPALLTLPVVATNEAFHWMWLNERVNGGVVVHHGTWNLAFITYSYALCAVGYVLLLVNVADTSRLHRWQAAVVLLAGSIPWAVNFLQILDIYPRAAPNPTPVAFILSSLLYFWGIFRLQLLEIMPVAQRLVIDQMVDGLVVLNGAGRIAMLNQTAETFLGVSNHQAVGRSLNECLPRWPALISELDAAASEHFEITGQQVKSPPYYDVRTAAIHDSKQRVLGRYLVLRDITRRRQAADELNRLLTEVQESNTRLQAEIRERQRVERELHVSEQSSRSLFDNAVMGLYRTTPAGQIVMANPALVKMLGYDSFAELARQDLEKAGFAPEYERPIFKETIERDGAIIGLESQWRCRDGTFIWVRENARAIRDPEGKVAYYDGTIEDISANRDAEERRRRLDEQIQEMQKLESLGVLAGGIAHDFNNLLAVIMGHAGMAEDDVPAGSAAAFALQQVNEAAVRAAELCRQMLAYSGKGRFEVRTVRLDTLLQENLHLIQAAVPKKAQLTLSLQNDLPGFRGDTGQLRQLLLNLATNAAEALTDRGGQLRIAAGSRWFTAEELVHYLSAEPLPAGSYVCLAVSDDGCGMTAEVRRRMFEPFFTTKFTGRGLGLSAVLGIVRGHGGAIAVETQLQHGTEVRVVFPVAAELPAAVKQTAPDSVWNAHGRILVADDEDLVRGTIRSALLRLGFEVVAVANGREAVERYQQEGASFRLVLLDLMMPVMDGQEALSEIRKLNPEVKVMLMSGYSETEFFRKHGLQSPAPFIAKPFTKDTLGQRIREMLE